MTKIDWNEVRCPQCESWEAKQEGSPVASEPCPACKKINMSHGYAHSPDSGSVVPGSSYKEKHGHL